MKGGCIIVIILIVFSFRLQGQDDNTIDSLFSKAAFYSRKDVDSSLFFLQKAYLAAHEAKRLENEVKALALLGDLYAGKTDYTSAIGYYIGAIKLAESKNQFYLAAKAYNGLGTIAYQRKDFAKAENYFKHAAFLKLEAGLVTHYAMIITNLSGVYFSSGKYDEALKNLQQMVPHLKNNEDVLASAYNSIGGVYQMGYQKLDSAEFYYQKSILIAEKGEYPEVLISAYHNLAEIYIIKKDFLNGIVMLNKALKISKKLEKADFSRTILIALSEAYQSTGDYKLALQCKNEAYQISEGLNSSQTNETIERLQIQFEAEKKNAELALKKEELLASELKYLKLKNRYGLLAAIAFLGIMAFAFGYYSMKQRRKTELRIQEERNTIFQNVVHEIKTPLSLISGPLRLIEETGNIEQLKKQLPLIERNSERLLRMINDMLNLAKIQTGKYLESKELGRPMEFIEQLASTFRAHFEANFQTLQVIIEDDQLVEFPKDAVHTIINNLLSNALKYAGQHAKILVKAKIDQGFIWVHYEDNGKGIAAKDIPNLFQRFSRGTNANGISGTGIGLALIQEVVEINGGKVTHFEVQPSGVGFKIQLPVYESTGITRNFSDGKLPILLLIEDDSDLSTFVQSLLEDEMCVIPAFNKEDALAFIQNSLPDIVLTDVMLPDGSGLDLLKLIKNNPTSSHIPVAVFSAMGSLQTKMMALETGATFFINKPFHPKELRQNIQNVMTEVRRIQQVQRESILDSTENSTQVALDPFVERAIHFIHQNLDNSEFGPDALGELLSISRSQLHRKLVSLTGQSTSNFIRMVRLKKAKDLLTENKWSMKEIAYMCGFSSPGYFSKSFKELFGVSPSDSL